jgi:hypothetical protein
MLGPRALQTALFPKLPWMRRAKASPGWGHSWRWRSGSPGTCADRGIDSAIGTARITAFVGRPAAALKIEQVEVLNDEFSGVDMSFADLTLDSPR